MYMAKSYSDVTSREKFLNDTTSLASSTESCKQHGSMNMTPKGKLHSGQEEEYYLIPK